MKRTRLKRPEPTAGYSGLSNQQRYRRQERGHSARERPAHRRPQECYPNVNSCPSLSTREDGVNDIPGFYYDPEKRKYFKITRDHPGPAVSQKQKQSQGQTELDQNRGKFQKHLPFASSIVKCLWDREYNSTRSFPRKCLEKLAQQLKVKQFMSLDPWCIPYNLVSGDDVSVTRIQPDRECTRILTLYDSNHGGQIVQFHCLNKDGNNNLEIIPKMAMMKEQLVTGLTWSPHENTSDFYMLSLLGRGAAWGETLMFQVDARSQRHMGTFPMRRDSLWCSSWNRNPLYSHILGMGGSKQAVTVDINTKRCVKYFQAASDVFALEFSRQDPICYFGMRNGCVRRCDIRVKDPDWPVICLNHGSLASITCVRLLDDENYLIASTLNGQIKKWDVRIRRCVQDFKGHVNETKHSLPFFLDPSDSLLFAAGQDSVTRIWSVTSGELLHCKPFSGVSARFPASIPALYFADEWGGRGGLPGLMYGTGNRITWYTY